MRSLLAAAMACLLALLAGCGSAPETKPAETSQAAAPAVPQELQDVAKALLGAESEIIVFGDLAHTGQQQALIVNRLAKTPQGAVPGLLITRAVVAEQDGRKWKEALRCDEHLKNPNGYLGATPLAPVTGWRLQHEQDARKGLVLYFTPLEMAGASHIPTIGVRWNPQVKRYQSLDRNFEQFLSEVPTLETPTQRLR
jgi:hypothetical protein